MSGSVEFGSAYVPGSAYCERATNDHNERQCIQLKVTQAVEQNKAYAKARIALGKKDGQESASTDTIEIDKRIERRGRDILETLHLIDVFFGKQKKAPDIDAILKDLQKETETSLTKLGYREVTTKLDSFAADLNRVKFSLGGAAVGGTVAFAGPKVAKDLEQWAYRRSLKADIQFGGAEFQNHGKAIILPEELEAEIRKAENSSARDCSRKYRQWRVLKGLESLVKTPLRANLVGAVITGVGVALDIMDARRTDGKKEEGKVPGSDLIA